MISATAEYALRASVFLAKNSDRLVNRQEIAQASNVPSDYLLKVLGALDAAGIVQSKRGPGGGYALRRSASEISTLEVILSVETIPRIKRCPLGISDHVQLGPLHQLLDDAARKIEEAFGRVSLADLAKASRTAFACKFPNLGKG